MMPPPPFSFGWYIWVISTFWVFLKPKPQSQQFITYRGGPFCYNSTMICFSHIRPFLNAWSLMGGIAVIAFSRKRESEISFFFLFFSTYKLYKAWQICIYIDYCYNFYLIPSCLINKNNQLVNELKWTFLLLSSFF